MSAKKTTGWVAAVVFGVALGVVITANLGLDQDAEAQNRDNLPRGRSAAAIQDGGYPATYSPTRRCSAPMK